MHNISDTQSSVWVEKKSLYTPSDRQNFCLFDDFSKALWNFEKSSIFSNSNWNKGRKVLRAFFDPDSAFMYFVQNNGCWIVSCKGNTTFIKNVFLYSEEKLKINVSFSLSNFAWSWKVSSVKEFTPKSAFHVKIYV